MASNRAIKQHLETIHRMRLMTLRGLGSDLTTEHLFYQIHGQGSHILWLTAHLAISMDTLINRYVFNAPALPESWRATYGGGSTPNSNPAENISFAEALGAMQKVLQTVEQHLGSSDDGILDRPVPSDLPIYARFQLHSQSIAFAPAHEGYHAGQIVMLRKIQGLPAASPV